MMMNSLIRQNVLMMFAGGALVAAGMMLSHHPQAAAIPPLPKADDLSAAFRQVASEAIPSIVSIETMTNAKEVQIKPRVPMDENSPLRQFFRNDPQLEELFKNQAPRRMRTPQQKGMGSGFIIHSNGTIMTNNHVVRGADEVRVRLHDGREFIAKDIKTDPRTDVAIVRIEASDLKPIRMGDSNAIQVGDWVLAIGSPFGLDMSVTAGIISAKGRSHRITERADFLQTDAAINPGNSGGPLINMRGEVIGINTAIATESGGYDGIGFAIPTHIASWVSEQLMSHGEVKRGYLGTKIVPIDAQLASKFKIKLGEGALVREVLPNSPAAKAGLEPEDVIVKLNGHQIEGPSALQGAVEQLTVGSTYPLEIIRGGKHLTLNVTIDALPKDAPANSTTDGADEQSKSKFDKYGLELSPLTKDLARQFNVKTASGVIVTAVQEGSVADQNEIRAGDIIEKAGGRALNSVEDYEKAKAEFAGGEGLVLHVRSANGRRFFTVLRAEEK
jgi:serine protease Do